MSREAPALRSRMWGLGVFTWVLGFATHLELTSLASRLGALEGSLRWQAMLGAGAIVLLVAGVYLGWTRTRPGGRVEVVLERLLEVPARRKLVGLLLSVVVVPVLPVAVYWTGAPILSGLFSRLLAFWIATLALSISLTAWFPRTTREQRILAAAVGYGLLFRALAYVPEVSSFPFSLAWSEASRYYYASLFHAGSLYGVQLGPSELHPTRYLLQSIPFLIPGAPLWLHRLWQVVLWWLLPAVVGILLVRRYRLTGFWLRAIVAGWVVLYLLQGPMQYHLLVMVVLVLVGVDPNRPLRSTIIILTASAWAGISRLNWFPVPAILGGCLYLLELPPAESWRRIARWPLLWVLLGTATAFAAQGAYVQMTGLGYDRFTSSLFSDLLVYRLFPNPTYFLGILPALLLASAPLGVALWRARGAWWARTDRPGRAYLAAALLVLGAGGLVVSLKIGGGSNLHNLDGFLILLLLVSFPLLLGSRTGTPSHAALPPFRVSALIVAIPIVFAVSGATAWPRRDFQAAAASLELLREATQAASVRGERVLFISQRHLLTFGMIEDVPLEPDFETVFLMEMAMSGNAAYLDRFTELLRDHAYDLIVVDHLPTSLQGRAYAFGEENDAWVNRVSTPILEYYRQEACLDGVQTCLYVPLTQAGDG